MQNKVKNSALCLGAKILLEDQSIGYAVDTVLIGTCTVGIQLLHTCAVNYCTSLLMLYNKI